MTPELALSRSSSEAPPRRERSRKRTGRTQGRLVVTGKSKTCTGEVIKNGSVVDRRVPQNILSVFHT